MIIKLLTDAIVIVFFIFLYHIFLDLLKDSSINFKVNYETNIEQKINVDLILFISLVSVSILKNFCR
jgi:hypothetical protein